MAKEKIIGYLSFEAEYPNVDYCPIGKRIQCQFENEMCEISVVTGRIDRMDGRWLISGFVEKRGPLSMDSPWDGVTLERKIGGIK